MTAKNKKPKKEPLRPIDTYFRFYEEQYPSPSKRGAQAVGMLFWWFGLCGLVWFIPFPYLVFFGRYNGFVNWFTFLMAILIYCYYRLSPMLSYFMLITFGLFSYLFVQLEYWEKESGPEPWLCCLAVFVLASIIGLIGRYIIDKKQGKKVSLLDNMKLLFIGPLWLWRYVFLKLSLRY
ncbi:hypothetical protein [Olivibacter sitiensis]|uniref:hypothetical protein n=1 Tax=Olivibacter sitiensis TaxID=376470 RepID=UPI0004274601|nr:hypothetical protein [Olivibacter sitiensis]